MNCSRILTGLVAVLLILASAPAAAAGFNTNAKKVWGVISGEVYWVTATDEEWVEGLDCALPPDDPTQTHSTASGWVWGLGWIEMESVHCTDFSGNGMARFRNIYGGGELTLSYEFEQNLSTPPPLLVVDSEWIIVGGDGRFEGAIGKLVGSAFLQPIVMIGDDGNPQPDTSVAWPAKWTLDGVAHGYWRHLF